MKAWKVARCHQLTFTRGLSLLRFVLLHFCGRFTNFSASAQLVAIYVCVVPQQLVGKTFLTYLIFFFLLTGLWHLDMPFLSQQCWILWFADVWTIHNNVSVETFNNPYVPLSITWDETFWVLCFLERFGKQNKILFCSNVAALPFLISFIYSPTHLFLLTVTHLGFALSVCPHRHHQNIVKGSL